VETGRRAEDANTDMPSQNCLVNLSMCEPATKMEGFCLCFVRLSHTQAEAVARRPNGLPYSRDLVYVVLSFTSSSLVLSSKRPCRGLAEASHSQQWWSHGVALFDDDECAQVWISLSLCIVVSLGQRETQGCSSRYKVHQRSAYQEA
jgi:hypothetical protein